jgi:hypothetical protein
LVVVSPRCGLTNLEGTKTDDRLLAVNLRRVTAGGFRQVLPAFEVNRALKVRLPRILHSGLECNHEHTFGAELPGAS